MRSIIPCCVSTCKKNNVLLHRFPNPMKHFPRFQIWLKKIDNAELFLMDPVKVYSNRRVCHQHFEQIYFSEGSKRLHVNAIPTLKLSGNRVNIISNHVIKAGEAQKQEKNVTSIMTAQSTICNEQEKYMDDAKDMGVLNDHNYAVMGKEKQEKNVTSMTAQSTMCNEQEKYRDDAKDMGVLNDHNYAVMGKEKQEKNVTSMTAQSTMCNEQEKYRDDAKDMGVLNDHNYAVMGKEKQEKNVTSMTAQSTMCNEQEKYRDDAKDQGPKNILRLCGIGRKDLTPKKKKLYSEVRRLYKKYNYTKHSKLSFKKRLVEAEEFQKKYFLEENINKLNHMASLLIKCQFREADKSLKQRRFTMNEKIMALTLYKQSARSYRFLSKIFILPSKATLHRLLIEIHFEPGLNTNIFKSLQKKVEKLDDAEKFVSVIFDEMSLMPGLNFNERQGFIEGFEDFGDGRSKYICDHALFFMIRGIKSNIKAPISYCFSSRGGAKSVQLKKTITKVLENVVAIGLKPITVICDQVGVNVSVLNSLMNDTKKKYSKQGRSDRYEYGFFEVGDFKIYPILDPPHLLKGIRNNLLKKNLQYSFQNTQRVAKWQHIKLLYENDCDSKTNEGLRALPHITALHIEEAKMKKMKVKLAAQIFSQRFSSTLMLASRLDSNKVLGEGAADTARLLLFFDRLFDSLNGGRKSAEGGKILRCGISETSDHIRFWTDEALPMLRSMKFEKKKPKDQARPPSLKNWTFTVKNFISIWNTLKRSGFKYLLPRRLNQDPIENMFGQARAFGALYTNPSPSSFAGIFKTMMVNSSFKIHKETFNCEDDEGKNWFTSTKAFFCDNSENIIPESSVTKDIPTCSKNIVNLREKLSKLVNNYVTGFILKKIKKLCKKCEVCNKSLFSGKNDPGNELIRVREYGNGWGYRLCYPTEGFVNFFHELLETINFFLKTYPTSKTLVTDIKQQVLRQNFDIFSCEKHRNETVNLIIKISTRTLLHNWCKYINNKIQGKDTRPYCGNDPVKKEACNIYLKRRKKKFMKNPKDSV